MIIDEHDRKQKLASIVRGIWDGIRDSSVPHLMGRALAAWPVGHPRPRAKIKFDKRAPPSRFQSDHSKDSLGGIGKCEGSTGLTGKCGSGAAWGGGALHCETGTQVGA